MTFLICACIRRLAARFAFLVARGPIAPARQRAKPPTAAGAKPRLPDPLPRGFGWLRRLLPGTIDTNAAAATPAAQLKYMLTGLDLLALIAADPAIGRVLRPLCHMLGVQLPPALRVTRSQRPRTSSVPSPRPAEIHPASPAAAPADPTPLPIFPPLPPAPPLSPQHRAFIPTADSQNL